MGDGRPAVPEEEGGGELRLGPGGFCSSAMSAMISAATSRSTYS